MISCSHWGLFQIVECADPMDMPQIDSVVLLFPKRAKASRRHSIKLTQSGSTE